MARTSIYENDDEFGVDSFRIDAEYLFDHNKTEVRLIKKNPKAKVNLQADFLGIRTSTFADTNSTIYVNIMSQTPAKRGLDRDGRSQRGGDVEYNCYAKYDVDIDDGDMIEFITDYDDGIKAGQKFVISFSTKGLYQGQYTFKHFTFKAI